jgi:FlaA1/EpsC-like NDP-sugar epimerase
VTATWPLTHPVRLARLVIDLAVLAVAQYLAFLLRFEGAIPAGEQDALVRSLPCVLLVQYLCLMLWNVPELSWRFVSLLEGRRIVAALMTAASVMFIVQGSVSRLPAGMPDLSGIFPPRSVILLNLLLGGVGLIGLRASVRLWCERMDRQRRGKKRGVIRVPTLLIGAGTAGAETIKQINAAPNLGIEPVGFLDDDASKRGLIIHGTRVLGPVKDVGKIANLMGAKQALVTIGSTPGENLRRIVDLCKMSGVPAKVIPGLHYILEGKVNLSAMREVAIDDLLRRDPVHLDLDSIAAAVQGRRIMITGAGGSIGSELCRIVSRFGPATLLLVENTENNLFHIHRELAADPNAPEIVPCLADICDEARMEQIFSTYMPEMVLHAAAYKHVPMIEWNPGEAVKNNVVGTRTLADLAHEYGVGEFVMISTDKAVNPTSIMGTSKRIAEIYVQALSQRSDTRFVTVRFGNVLGSAGSVLPTFKEQIARGGPVTVTHPKMERFFMTIPEASELVLQAATMGRGGEIFILDMGKPVKIVDLARNLIALSGFGPDDIEIRYTGIRPGEKLTEELSFQHEAAKKTKHPKIFIGQHKPADWDVINREIDELDILADAADLGMILDKLKEIVPEFEPEIKKVAAVSWVRTDGEYPRVMLNGNGKAVNGKAGTGTASGNGANGKGNAGGSVKRKRRASLSLNRVKPHPAPLDEPKPNGSLPARGPGETQRPSSD